MEVEEGEFDLDLTVQANSASNICDEDSCDEDDGATATYTPLLHLYLFFLFMFQSIFRLSDHALDVLLKFLSMFFKSLGKVSSLPQSFLHCLPSSIYSARKKSGNKRDQFTRYVSCPSCHCLYCLDNCVVKSADHVIESKKCAFVRFPFHPQRQHRKSCDSQLMKRVKSKCKGASLYPRRVYCYKSLVDSLQDMLKQPDFSRKCELWRHREQEPGVFSDVYDGDIWKEFLNPNGQPFLSIPNNYALQLNVDWFNPYKHTQHSEGAIYLSILNLPRNERFLQENIILVGVIPGPKEPPLLINTYLEPLVDELIKLWSGVIFKDHNGHSTIVRAALLCSSCDIPASRKVCGFVGHNAFKACSKCSLSFPTASFGENPDFSNFDKTQWDCRQSTEHRIIAERHRKCNTRSNQKSLEREYGVRYSVLLKLPYFDPIKMCVVDPMHNLLLGTAKHITEIWKSSGILTSKDFDIIQEKVDSMVTPTDIGRIPFKIASKFSGFTAEQWKNWVVYYSLFSLKDVLPWRHYNCWHLYVKICFLLCRRRVTEAQLREADALLDEFWESFKQLYGAAACTINLHLHGHLTSCIKDFGPVYSFWCFAYERMNGILGSYHTNNHHVSIQYMHKFLDSKTFLPIYWPQEFAEEYLPLLQDSIYQKGSLMQTNLETEIPSSHEYTPLPPVQEIALTSSQKLELHPYINGESFEILTLCRKAKALRIRDHVLGAKGSRHSRSSLVLAERNNHSIELAEIEYFFQYNVLQSNHSQAQTFWVAVVNWYLEHPCRVWYGNPVQVWTTVNSPVTSYISVKSIKSRLIYTKCTRDFGTMLVNDTVYVITPLT